MNIVFELDFENSSLGSYRYDDWKRDWNNPKWNNGLDDYCTIVDKDGDRAMRSYMPKGEWGLINTPTDTNGGGFQWWPPMGDGHTELYMSYNIMFRPGVDYVISGKLPGLLGGPQDMDPGRAPNFDEGFTSFLAFHGDDPRGLCAFYLYHQDQKGDYGDLYVWPNPHDENESRYVFKKDNVNERWINITLRVVLNTLNESGGNYDGIVEGFIDGKLMYQKEGLRLRNVPEVTIDHMMMSWFYGGNTENFATTAEEWILIDDVYAFNYESDSSEPKGNVLSQKDRILSLPWSKGEIFEQGETGDVEAPTTPKDVELTDFSHNSLSFSWTPSTDNVAVTAYRIHFNGKLDGAVTTPSFTKTGLDPETSYTFSISAIDAEGNESQKSEVITAETGRLDAEPPSAPENLRVISFTGYSINIEWDSAEDNLVVDRYEIVVDGEHLYSTEDNSFTLSNLNPNTNYTIAVRAVDGFNNAGPLSASISQRTGNPDLQAPTTPTGLRKTDATEKTISLEWDASTDNVGVREYRIYLNNIYWESSSRTEETIAKLQPGLDYNISLSAIDEAGNESSRSTDLKVRTLNDDVTVVPTYPTISIIQVHDNSSNLKTVSEMSSLGYVELGNFGLEISEINNPDESSLVLKGNEFSEVIHEGRINNSLQVLYNFSEGEGNKVRDISGSEQPIDLDISKEGLATEWLKGQGLRIKDNTELTYEGTPVRLLDSLSSTNEITLEAWIRQEDIGQSGPARIVSISGDNSTRGATLAHDGNSSFYNYITRLNTSDSDENGIPELNTSQDFVSSTLHHIVYTRSSFGIEKIYVNGLELASGFRDGDFSTWRDDYQLILGNEVNGERPWKGVFYLVAVYNRALSRGEVSQNYESGSGNVQFTNKLDVLEANIPYKLKPYVSTDQGLVFGQPKDFIYQLYSRPDSLFTFYPNPNQGQVTITISNDDESITEGHLRLADASGRVHFFKEIDLSAGLIETVLEIQLPSAIKNGLYSLILNKGNKSAAERLVLVR